MNLKLKISKATASLRASEKNVKIRVAELSRDLLQYIVIDSTPDIESANRFVEALTPVNRRVAVLFLTAFLPFRTVTEEGEGKGEFVRFGKMDKRQVEAKTAACEEFLADENKTLWTWQKENVNIDKPVDYVGRVTKAVTAALKHDTGVDDVIKAVLAGGLSADDILAIMGELVDDEEVLAEAA